MSISEEKVKYSIEEYLALEEKAENKSEYYDGEIYLMSGGTIAHGLIGANMARHLGNALDDRDCSVFGGEVKVRIESANAFVYPDAMVVCGDEERFNDLALTNPILVVEVLSESTAAWNYTDKFRLYQMLPSLEEYVLIEQKKPQVDVFRRNDDGLWFLEGYKGLEAMVELKSLGVEIALKDIYRRVKF